MAAELLRKGAGPIFDEMQEVADINSVLVFAATLSAYQYRHRHETDETTGKPIDEVFVRTDPTYYEGLPIKVQKMPDSAFGDRDVLDEAIAAANPRDGCLCTYFGGIPGNRLRAGRPGRAGNQ
ncbi:MAG: hypothetical protein ACFB21_00860 [Opitutales bacterium]